MISMERIIIGIRNLIHSDRKKRIADMLEKLGIGSLIWGLFQGFYSGYAVGLICIVLSIYLTDRSK